MTLQLIYWCYVKCSLFFCHALKDGWYHSRGWAVWTVYEVSRLNYVCGCCFSVVFSLFLIVSQTEDVILWKCKTIKYESLISLVCLGFFGGGCTAFIIKHWSIHASFISSTRGICQTKMLQLSSCSSVFCWSATLIMEFLVENNLSI